MSEVQGTCLCGAVKFTAVPVSSEVGACHCTTCRGWCSGPFMGIDCGATLQVEQTDSLGVYNSSEWAERGFCKTCGSSLFYRLKDSGQSFVSVEALGVSGNATLSDEVFVDEKPDYYAFAQATRKMTGPELFALFQDQGEAK